MAKGTNEHEGEQSAQELTREQRGNLNGALRTLFRKHHDYSQIGHMHVEFGLRELMGLANIPEEFRGQVLQLLERPLLGIRIIGDEQHKRITFDASNFYIQNPLEGRPWESSPKTVPSDEQVMKDAESGSLKGRKIA
ncbi:MAG: hypothetical protein A2804_00650 [Candidatus Pacebacteria bacterium RIFCSPHIGHO2_01_FULL_46_10]|nr:MAG: hypothetical protein A2804_00650 [Candidatus Pacebacteria bacterium RIFCSPHIGHO2_01_FULL_46_10]